MPEYRKRKDSDAWHWCRNCSNWPTRDYDVRYSKPTSGELDNECRAKERAGNCRVEWKDTKETIWGFRGEPEVIRRKFLTQVVMAVVTLIAGMTVSLVITWRITPEKYASVKNEFFRQVQKQITFGTVDNVEDVEMIRIGVSRERDSEKLRLDDLQGLLTEYLVWVSLDKAADEEQQVRQMIRAKAVKAILREVTSQKPFSILPEEDQLTAIELKSSIESGDKDTALSRMELLTSSLGKEISSLKRRTEGSWRWTIYSALIGGIGVVVTIVLSLLYRGVSRSREFGYLMRRVEDLRDEVNRMQNRMGPQIKEGQSP